MTKFRIIVPDGSLKFEVESENAETALRDLKTHLANLEPPISTQGDFSITPLEAGPPTTGIFGPLYRLIAARDAAMNAALMAERNALPETSIN